MSDQKPGFLASHSASLLVPIFILGANSAYASGAAGPFAITNRQHDPIYDPAQAQFNTMADSIETTINTGIMAPASRQGFLDSMAQASAGAGKGQGADYAANPSRIVLGVSGGLSFQSPSGLDFSSALKSNNNALPSLGVGAQITALVGAKAREIGIPDIGGISADKLFLYVNLLSVSKSFSNFSTKVFNLGAHAQYQVVQPRSAMLIGWGGVLFTTGLEYGTQTSSFSQAISYSQSQSINFGAPFGTQTGTVAWNSNFNLGVQSTVFSLPLELSSSFNILYFLSLYMGVGMDLNTGSSTTVGGASGPITVTTSGGTLPGNVFSGDGKLVLDNTGVNGTPSFSDFRLFLGTELNLWAVKVVIQGNYMSNKTLAAFLGLRVAY